MRSPAPSVLAGLVVFVGLVLLLRALPDSPGDAADRGGPPPDADVTAPATDPTRFEELEGPTVPASEVCPRAAYLCHGFRARGIRRVMRWPDDAGEIEIRVPRPAHVEPGDARRLQAAAVRGILAWQNAPFPIRITRSDRPGPEDFAVSWSRSVVGSELGRTATRWERRGGDPRMRVEEMVLATHGPSAVPRLLDPEIVELTAAHEMGHALGLPHSDEERDLMYPTNTAARLSTRDYRAMEALYRLENGVEVVEDGG